MSNKNARRIVVSNFRKWIFAASVGCFELLFTTMANVQYRDVMYEPEVSIGGITARTNR